MVYLDNNATTRLDPRVREAMLPYLDDEFANPSSPYTFARRAALAITKAREQVARLVGAQPEEIHFTSGGTEANNAALNHLLATGGGQPLALSAVEHASVRNYALHRTKDKLLTESVAVLDSGRPAAGRHGVAAPLLAMMWANNETGVIFHVPEYTHGRRVHSDAVQAAGKIPLNLGASGVETAALSAHKIHGPKGVGALYIRQGTKFEPFLIGGDQESARRAGTENVAGIVGFGAAAELALEHLDLLDTEIRSLRDTFEERIAEFLPDTLIAGRSTPRIPNTSMLVIPECETEAVLALLDMEGICVSSGSACASGSHEPSHVLRAMGLPVENAATIRVSLSRFTTADEVDALSEALPRVVAKLRGV
jgi:cysteine desulfurase